MPNVSSRIRSNVEIFMRPPCMLSLRDRGAENSSGTMTWVKKEEIVAKISHWEWKTQIERP